MTMNRHISLPLISFITGLFCILSPIEAQAGSKEKTLGLAGGYASYNNSGFTNIYFHYSFSRHVRIAPEIGYVFRHDDKTAIEYSVDVHFPFRLTRGLNIYPLAGLTANTWSSAGKAKRTRGGFDFGAGFDLYMTSSLKFTIQGKYSLINDFNGVFAEIGIGYIF